MKNINGHVAGRGTGHVTNSGFETMSVFGSAEAGADKGGEVIMARFYLTFAESSFAQSFRSFFGFFFRFFAFVFRSFFGFFFRFFTFVFRSFFGFFFRFFAFVFRPFFKFFGFFFRFFRFQE